MPNAVKLLVYPTTNIEASKATLKAFLGVDPYVDSPYYVGYKTDTIEIGLDPYGQQAIAYTEVSDIEASLAALIAAGATMQQEPTDVGGGMLIAKAIDASGNVLGLRQRSIS